MPPSRFFTLDPLQTPQASIVVGPIPVSFSKFVIELFARGTDPGVNVRLQASVDGTAVHDYEHGWFTGAAGALSSEEGHAVTQARAGFLVAGGSPAKAFTFARIECLRYDSLQFDKVLLVESSFANAYSAGNVYRGFGTIIWRPATPAPITMLTLSGTAGNFDVGTSCVGWLYP